MVLLYLKDGIYLWNSGMFFMRVDVLLDLVSWYLFELSVGMIWVVVVLGILDEWEVLYDVFQYILVISIDYGIMEWEFSWIVVILIEFGWSDVGLWWMLIDFCEFGWSNLEWGDVIVVECIDLVIVIMGLYVVMIGLEGMVVVVILDVVLVVFLDCL